MSAARMPLAQAEKRAAQVVSALAPFCQRIEIAGSIRRRRPDVGDVDIVLIPGGEDCRSAISDRVRSRMAIISDGPYIISGKTSLLNPNAWQLDIYIAHCGIPDLISPQPSNWASILLCRTGSKEHNARLANLAHSRGLKWSPQIGLIEVATGRILDTATEEDIYQALGLSFIQPEDRV